MRKMGIVCLALVLVLGLLGGMTVSAASACPQMPKGAENLFKPDTMEKLGDGVLAFYETETLLMESRSIHELYGKTSVAFDFDKKMKKEFVLSFWGKAGSDGMKYTVRLMDDGEGGYCEVLLSRGNAEIFSTIDGTLERMTRPSNKLCMAASKSTTMGEWKLVEIRVKPGTSQTELMIYIDGEQMKTSRGESSVKVGTDQFSMMFGASAVMSIRGIRIYEVNNKAKEFEPAFDPDKEWRDAPDGTDGDDGGTGVVRIPAADENGGEGGDGTVGGSTGNKGDKGDKESGNMGLILGIAGGAVAVIAIVVVVLLASKKKKAAVTEEAPVEKEGDDQ